MELLLETGAARKTTFHAAAIARQLEVAKLLLEQGVSMEEATVCHSKH